MTAINWQQVEEIMELLNAANCDVRLESLCDDTVGSMDDMRWRAKVRAAETTVGGEWHSPWHYAPSPATALAVVLADVREYAASLGEEK